MIRINSSVDNRGARFGLARLSSRAKNGMNKAVRESLKETKPDVRTGVRSRYTYKGAIKMRTRASGGGGTLTVYGARNTIRKFTHQPVPKPKPKTYLRAVFVRGTMHTFTRAFAYHGTYLERIDSGWEEIPSERYPLEAIYGTSTPEMAGHEPYPARMIEQALMKRLEAKVGAMLNG